MLGTGMSVLWAMDAAVLSTHSHGLHFLRTLLLCAGSAQLSVQGEGRAARLLQT